jgi:hypothetical protein
MMQLGVKYQDLSPFHLQLSQGDAGLWLTAAVFRPMKFSSIDFFRDYLRLFSLFDLKRIFN